METLQSRFNELLKDKGVLEYFRLNVDETSVERNAFNEYDWICTTFDWNETSQGYDFWYRLDSDWVDIVDDYEDDLIRSNMFISCI